MTFTALVHSDDMRARLQEVAPDSTSGLSKEDRGALEDELIKLLAYADVRKREYESCNARMLRAIKGLTGVAQRWGLYGIDVVRGEVTVGSWTQIPGEAWHVQKLPMPGWMLFASVRARLS